MSCLSRRLRLSEVQEVQITFSLCSNLRSVPITRNNRLDWIVTLHPFPSQVQLPFFL